MHATACRIFLTLFYIYFFVFDVFYFLLSFSFKIKSIRKLFCVFNLYMRSIHHFYFLNNFNHNIIFLGHALRCFECNSHFDPKCARDNPLTELSVDCGEKTKLFEFQLCRKIHQTVEYNIEQGKVVIVSRKAIVIY